jgi:protein TonB
MPNPGADAGVSTDVAAAGGTVAGAGGGSRGRNYVAPDFNVSYFSNPKPEYPPLSRRLREQGLVKLRVHVTVEGRAGEVMLHKSSGYERLDNAALNAVKRWRFRPARQAGVPVADWAVVPMLFDLND